MSSRPQIDSATMTAHTQFVAPNCRDTYATTRLELEEHAIVVTICGPGNGICERRQIVDPAVMNFIRWHLDTVADLSQRTNA